jgi:hypothetical protein
MKSRHTLAVTFTLIMLLAAVVPASAAEPMVDNHWIELSGGTWNPCADEWVELRGSVHYLEMVVMHDDGSGILESHMNANISGEGESGTNYVLIQVSNEHATWAFDYAPYSYTQVYQYQAIAPGPHNNDVYWDRQHVTVNANGTVTRESEATGWDCR